MLTDSLSGVESPSVQESLRNAKQIVRTKNSRSTAVDEEKIQFLNELVVMVGNILIILRIRNAYSLTFWRLSFIR